MLTLDSLKNFGFAADTTGNLYSWISTDDTHLYVYGMTEIDPIVAEDPLPDLTTGGGVADDVNK